MRTLIAIMIGSSIAACATALTPLGEKVKIVSTSPGPECKSLGDVVGVGESGTAGQNVVNARNDIRNKAGEMGANTVILQTNNQIGARVDMTGQAFTCSQAAE